MCLHLSAYVCLSSFSLPSYSLQVIAPEVFLFVFFLCRDVDGDAVRATSSGAAVRILDIANLSGVDIDLARVPCDVTNSK